MCITGRIIGTLSLFILGLSCFACSGQQIDFKPPAASTLSLEENVYEVTPEGGMVMSVRPNIESLDELLQYREFKLHEITEILDITEDASAESPYYPVVVTFQKPVTLSELNQILTGYNPSFQKAAKFSTAGDKSLLKADAERGTDGLIINAVRFNTTTGHGQLSYDSISDLEGLSQLETKLAEKELDLNGIDNFELVKNVTSIIGGVHRQSVMPLNNDPHVYLADIGPAELYKGEVVYAFWDDLTQFVNKYLNN